jgi:hypothetical protein
MLSPIMPTRWEGLPMPKTLEKGKHPDRIRPVLKDGAIAARP